MTDLATARFDMTPEFAQAHDQHAAAYGALCNDSVNPEGADFEVISEAEYAALDRMMLETPAYTAAEISRKLWWFFEHEIGEWVEAQRYREALEADLKRQRSWPVSPGVLRCWMAWREHDERCRFTEARSEILLKERDHLHSEIGKSLCVASGDFVLKQYLRLHDYYGSTIYGENEQDMSGNLWDIDICDNGFEGTHDTIDKLSCYADIDCTDVGANLLAYGLPHFDAEAWMERADAVGLQVRLLEQADGRPAQLALSEDSEAHLPRIQRERDRLRRIADFDPDRIVAICVEIRREWPQLVCRPPAIAEAA